MHGGNGQIVEVVKNLHLAFFHVMMKYKKWSQTKWLNITFSHIHNGVHTYITKRNVLHLNILQQNYEKFMTSEQMHL